MKNLPLWQNLPSFKAFCSVFFIKCSAINTCIQDIQEIQGTAKFIIYLSHKKRPPENTPSIMSIMMLQREKNTVASTGIQEDSYNVFNVFNEQGGKIDLCFLFTFSCQFIKEHILTYREVVNNKKQKTSSKMCLLAFLLSMEIFWSLRRLCQNTKCCEERTLAKYATRNVSVW